MALWDKITSRGNVSDRRGVVGASGMGLAGIIVLMGVTYLLGGNPLQVLIEQGPSSLQQASTQEDASQYSGEDSYELFVSQVLGSTDDAWSKIFSTLDKQYVPPELVLFRNNTQSQCGGANSVSGPHYCPDDEKIYLDETFFAELESKLGAQGGDVAEAYVIAHEVGHHVQYQLGLLDGRQLNNAQSIEVELQADCFAGLWAYSIKDQDILAFGEINEAIDAAAAVGDDSIQQRTQGEVQPETWTHGSSAERIGAFNEGYTNGVLNTCLAYTDDTI